ncbi:MAG: PTS ascorbate transporter subunit IIC, partial [Alphaproteobacteria bacterium]|nr:PTS ascorbate transporter subunit IIC [Alphaproteobacteria bacterium]
MFSLLLDILSIPALLVGLIVFLGLVLQKKPSQDVILGTFKSILGFVILGGGAGILVASLSPFGEMFQEAFHLQGIVPNNEAIVALSLKEYGSSTALIMFFGMVANILIARFTP